MLFAQVLENRTMLNKWKVAVIATVLGLSSVAFADTQTMRDDAAYAEAQAREAKARAEAAEARARQAAAENKQRQSERDTPQPKPPKSK